MTLTADKIHSCQIHASQRVEPEAFEIIRRKVMLEFCKWDGQIGDVATLADFALLLSREQWLELSTFAETASAELVAAERELLSRPDLHHQLGLPRRVRRALSGAQSESPAVEAVRVMRFDFHPTPDGWRVSEVNSDVPGGFTESSNFSRLMSEQCGASTAGDPSARWADAIAAAARNGAGPAALLYAVGYLEDMQIMAHLQNQLARRGVEAHLAKAQQIYFSGGEAYLASEQYAGPLGVVVRFVQGEWLSTLPRRHWIGFYFGSQTAVANPATAILTESKRFALVMDRLKTPLPTWRSLLPETCDPRVTPWASDDRWILKTALCNTGDTVCMRERLTPKQWRSIRWSVAWNPWQWIAQKRFAALATESPIGTIYPCIGVYTVDGKAAGIYGRFSRGPLIDYSAVDVAVLVEN